MTPSTRTPEGQPNRCPVCGKPVMVEPSLPTGDAPCPHCGCLLWFPQTIGRRASFGIRRFSIAEPSTRTKQQAIRAVLDRLVEVGALETEHREGVLAAILKREELGSTGIGRGVAVPHAKYAGLKTPLCAIAEFKFGIDFESLDGQPVRSICLLVSPPDFAGEHVRVLAELAHLLSAVG